MGQAILYCFKCSTQLREAHFEKGKAFRVDAWVTCSDCAPELAKTLPPNRVQVLLDLMAGKDKKAASVTPPPMRDSRLSITPADFPATGGAPARPKWPLISGIAAIAVVLVAAGFLMSDSGSGKIVPSASTNSVAPPPPPVPGTGSSGVGVRPPPPPIVPP